MFLLKFPLNKVYWPTIRPRYYRQKPTLTAAVFYRLNSKYPHFVLLPEIPDDTAETNSLLKDSDLPNYDDLDAKKSYRGMGRHALDYEAGIFEIERHIKDASEPVTFNSIFGKLEKLTARLTFSWATVKNLFCIRADKMTPVLYAKIHHRASMAFSMTFRSSVIYEACKEIHEKEKNLNALQKRVVARMMLEAKLNGVALPSRERDSYDETFKQVRFYEDLYRRKLEASTERFSYRIIDYGIVKDFPEHLLRLMADNSSEYLKGPWTVTHQPYVYNDFMKHCPHKDLRLNAWKAYIIRSSQSLDTELNSGLQVSEIRDHRKYLAKHLGYDTYADMSMETKMAGTVDNVLAVLDGLFVKAKEKQLKELKSLNEFAGQNGFSGELEECDVDYWRRKQMINISKWKDEDFDSHFPFSHVWKELLSFCSNLLDIHFEEVTNQVKTWDQHVQFYNVLDSEGRKMSSFYIDPFQRPNKARVGLEEMECVSFRARCDSLGNLPLISIIFNFNMPLPKTNKESLLSVEEVKNLFKQFGFSLQELLPTVPYLSISGHANMEWDAIDVSSNFLLFWLQEPSVVEKISKHYISGLPLSKEGVTGFTKAMTHMAGHDLSNELFLSLMDIRFYTEEKVFYEVLEEMWKKHKPFPYNKKNALPCWFDPIMCGGYPAAYYSHWWSKMVAADIFRAFKECEPHEVADVGKRYRDTFLSLGGGCKAAEVFRKFRGRDPVPEALLTVLGIS